MQFKQKNSFKNYRPFQNWLNLKKNVYLILLPLNSRKLNWVNAYIEPRIAVYLNYTKLCWFPWLLTRNSFPWLLSLNHIQFCYSIEWLWLEDFYNLTFTDDLYALKSWAAFSLREMAAGLIQLIWRVANSQPPSNLTQTPGISILLRIFELDEALEIISYNVPFASWISHTCKWITHFPYVQQGTKKTARENQKCMIECA